MTDLDDDFADLDLIIAEHEAKKLAARALSGKQKKLAKGGLNEEERNRLLAEVRTYEEAHVWTTSAAIALFHTQECLSCGHKHRFFLGWMTQQDHKRDAHCRRLVRGRPLEPVVAKVEEHAQPPVEMCGDCCEASLAIERIVGRVNADIESKQMLAAIEAHRLRQLEQEQQNG